MLRTMDYVVATLERGLFLSSKREWGGKNLGAKFKISCKSDSDCTKCNELSKSITDCWLCDLPKWSTNYVLKYYTENCIIISNWSRNEGCSDINTRYVICLQDCKVTGIESKIAHESSSSQYWCSISCTWMEHRWVNATCGCPDKFSMTDERNRNVWISMDIHLTMKQTSLPRIWIKQNSIHFVKVYVVQKLL